MDLTFKLSDDQKFNCLWELLNADGYYSICAVYDDYAIVFNYQNGGHERIYYTKDDATDSITIDRRETCYILDVTESEKKALEALRALNGDSYELADEKFGQIEGLQAKISENDTKVEELNTTISTLTVERDEATTKVSELEGELNTVREQYATAENTIASITTERDVLATYKKNVEDAAKLSVINSYAESLSDEVLEQFRNSIDTYTAEDLDIKLTYEQKKAHPELFSQQAPKPAYVPKDDTFTNGLEEILAKYENKK